MHLTTNWIKSEWLRYFKTISKRDKNEYLKNNNQ